MRYILGIDTSNYKTSVAVVDQNQHIVCDLRRFLKVKKGEKGLRQSDALFQHIKSLPEMMEEIRNSFDGVFDGVAYSAKPRPVEGSYMPVFLAGEGVARAVASALQIPVRGFSHQEGHIEAIKAYSPWRNEDELLACHFSGGTCEILQVTRQHCDKAGTDAAPQVFYSLEIVGGSKDISFGQVLDRMGVQLGYDFPAGERLDQIALHAESGRRLLKPLLTPIKVRDAQLNLSGIDTQIKNLLLQDSGFFAKEPGAEDILILEFFEKMTAAIARMLQQAAEKTGLNRILMAGGVASSRYLQNHLPQMLQPCGIEVIFDQNGLSQDNAVGIALLGGACLWA